MLQFLSPTLPEALNFEINDIFVASLPVSELWFERVLAWYTSRTVSDGSGSGGDVLEARRRRWLRVRAGGGASPCLPFEEV